MPRGACLGRGFRCFGGYGGRGCKQESKRGEGGAAGLGGLQLLCRTVPEAKPVGGGCEEP